MSTKRARRTEDDDDNEGDDGQASSSAAKVARSADEQNGARLLCTLPPTCCPPLGRATPLRDTHELEAHYARCHAHVCSAPSCGRVFPDARLLELHHTECHDPIAAMRKERGEKIFACHIATCPKVCATPRTRRLHLIEMHHYPKQYFFAVTNKGIGGLLQQWGEGATLIRGEWKPRSGPVSGGWQPANADTDTNGDVNGEEEMAVDADAAEDGAQEEEDDAADALSIPPGQSLALTRRQKSRIRQREKRAQRRQQQDPELEPETGEPRRGGNSNGDEAAPARASRAVRFADADADTKDENESENMDADADDGDDGERPGLGDGMSALVDQLGAMSFVPSSVKFGRGAAARAFPHGPRVSTTNGDEEGAKKPRRASRGGRGRPRKKPSSAARDGGAAAAPMQVGA